MDDQLTPRQNEIISEALAQIAVAGCLRGDIAQVVEKSRCVMVEQMQIVTRETDVTSSSSNLPSVAGHK